MSRKCMTDCAAREYVTAYVNTLETMICGMTCARLDDSISGNFIDDTSSSGGHIHGQKYPRIHR